MVNAHFSTAEVDLPEEQQLHHILSPELHLLYLKDRSSVFLVTFDVQNNFTSLNFK